MVSSISSPAWFAKVNNGDACSNFGSQYYLLNTGYWAKDKHLLKKTDSRSTILDYLSVLQIQIRRDGASSRAKQVSK